MRRRLKPCSAGEVSRPRPPVGDAAGHAYRGRRRATATSSCPRARVCLAGLRRFLRVDAEQGRRRRRGRVDQGAGAAPGCRDGAADRRVQDLRIWPRTRRLAMALPIDRRLTASTLQGRAFWVAHDVRPAPEVGTASGSGSKEASPLRLRPRQSLGQRSEGVEPLRPPASHAARQRDQGPWGGRARRQEGGACLRRWSRAAEGHHAGRPRAAEGLRAERPGSPTGALGV